MKGGAGGLKLEENVFINRSRNSKIQHGAVSLREFGMKFFALSECSHFMTPILGVVCNAIPMP